MAMATTQTPTDLKIASRDLHFDDSTTTRWWHGGDPVATAFYNALSASFPMGERYFIDSVRRFRHTADLRLQEQIAVFITQESLHTREHLAFNQIAANRGYDLTRIDAYLKRRFAWARTRAPLEQLASTIALEHFTAILAHALLDDPRHLAGSPAGIKKLWQWHAIEEIEHKGVAYDTYLAATNKSNSTLRWLRRSYVMTVTTILFLHELVYSTAQFFKQDKINTPTTWIRFLRYVFVRPGVLRSVMGRYFAFFKPGFHPWNVDDRVLIAKYDLSVAP
jgi:hypothetical protein